MQRKFSERFAKELYSFAGPRSINFLSATVILGFLSFGSTINEKSADAQELILWSGIASRSFVVAIVYYFIFGSFIKKFLVEIDIRRVTAIWLLFFTTEIFRTLYVAKLGLTLALISDPQLIFRIVSGGATGLVIFGLTAFVQNNNFQYRNTLQELDRVKDELTETLSVTEDDIKSIRTQVLTTLRSAINNSLNLVTRTSDLDKSDSKIIVDELVRVSEEVVRPLSHEIFNTPLEVSKSGNGFRQSTVSSRQIIDLATSVTSFQPELFMAVSVPLTIGVVALGTLDLLTSLFVATIFVAGIYLICWFGKTYLTGILTKLNLPIRFLVFSVVNFAITAFVFSNSLFLKFFDLTWSTSNAIYFFIFVSFLTGLLAFYSANNLARAKTLESIIENNEFLNWHNARLRAQLAIEQQQLSNVIHRDVQGKLIAAALKFQQDVASGKNSRVAMEQLNELIGTITDVVYVKNEIPTLSEVVANLNDIWDGIIHLDLSVDSKAEKMLARDKICLQSVGDLIAEFATNSVKHGKSTEGKIYITLAEQNLLILDMTNNGLPMLENSAPGLGSQMASQHCLSAVRNNLPSGGVQFLAKLPIA